MFRIVVVLAHALAIASQSIPPTYSPARSPAFGSASGLTSSCRDLEALGFQRLIPEAFCTKTLNEAVLQACGCDGIIYSAAPSSTSQVATMAPNIPSTTASARPTIRSTASMPVANPLLLSPIAPSTPTAPITPTAPTTLAPGTVITLPPILANLPTPQGGFAVCYVCGIGYFVKDKNAVVTFSGLTSSCRDLEALGFQRLIPEAFCTKTLNEAVLQACGCDEIIYSAAPSSTSQAATMAPSSFDMTTSTAPSSSSSSTSQSAAPNKSAGFTIMSGSATASILATASSLLLFIVL